MMIVFGWMIRLASMCGYTHTQSVWVHRHHSVVVVVEACLLVEVVDVGLGH